MKRTLTILFAGLLAMSCLVGCGERKDMSEMTQEEKMVFLDAKIKRNPKDAELHFLRGQLFMEMQNVNNAIRDFQKATELNPKEVKYFTALGDAFFSNGNVGDSYKALQEALRIDENNLEALLKMGEISFYSRDYDRAIESLSKVTKIDQNNRTALFMKGFVYMEKGDTSNAVGLFTKVTELYPDYEPAFEQLGMLYAFKHDKLGVEYLNTALKLEPKNINVLYGLGMLYQEIEEADKATEYYVKILEINPNYTQAWYNRGYMALLLYEDYDSAVDFFTKVIELDNQNVDAHYNRGLAYKLKGDNTNAKICFEAALNIDPNYEPAKKEL